MNLEKHSKTIPINEFINKIDKDAYAKFFTAKEILSFGNKRKKGSLAARFLIKNVLIEKSNNRLTHTNIEILNNEQGKPVLSILSNNNVITEKIHISLSHSKDIAAALIIFETYE